MNKQDFRDQVNARGQELKELEDLTEKFAAQLKQVQPLMRGSMIASFRAGVAACLNYLDDKAKNIHFEKQLQEKMKSDFLGKG